MNESPCTGCPQYDTCSTICEDLEELLPKLYDKDDFTDEGGSEYQETNEGWEEGA
uniref:Uncharacterized protein n=1 Tax=viral metagenome TaxID=1070528 RepID=A0A6H1Z9V2_9ZZZZ